MTCHSREVVFSLPSLGCHLWLGGCVSVTPESTEDAGPSNFDRLRSHLSAEDLASHLLDSWLADRSKSADELLSDLEAFYESKEA